MSETRISVSYEKKTGLPNYSSETHRVGVDFVANISADCERELAARIERAQAFCRERVFRQSEPQSDELKSLIGFLDKADDVEKLDKLLAFAGGKFSSGKIDRRELIWLEEMIEDKRVMIAPIDLPAGDAMPLADTVQDVSVAETVAKMKAQLGLKLGSEVEPPKVTK